MITTVCNQRARSIYGLERHNVDRNPVQFMYDYRAQYLQHHQYFVPIILLNESRPIPSLSCPPTQVGCPRSNAENATARLWCYCRAIMDMMIMRVACTASSGAASAMGRRHIISIISTTACPTSHHKIIHAIPFFTWTSHVNSLLNLHQDHFTYLWNVKSPGLVMNSSLLESNEINVIFVRQLCDIVSLWQEKVSYLWHYCAQQVDIDAVSISAR